LINQSNYGEEKGRKKMKEGERGHAFAGKKEKGRR